MLNQSQRNQNQLRPKTKSVTNTLVDTHRILGGPPQLRTSVEARVVPRCNNSKVNGSSFLNLPSSNLKVDGSTFPCLPYQNLNSIDTGILYLQGFLSKGQPSYFMSGIWWVGNQHKPNK